ncbi:MAG TPA: hypothetical protein VFE50_21540 [Cyclobacteriaceae bacterium]|nr:hypothetical protein [Cyclobacteriaceae bacterium]
MYKRVLPIFLIVLAGCGSQPASESASTDSIPAADSIPEEQGNPDGDIFVTDALKNAISNETNQPDTVSEYGNEEKEEEEEHVHVDDTMSEVFGFSDNGDYFAFKSVESGDGYGPRTVTVFVIDVKKNEWASKPLSYVDDSETEGATDLNKAKADEEKLLKKFNIVPGKNLGYDYGFKGVNPNNVIIINEDRYVLDFKSNNGMIELRVKGQGKDILLQKDSKVPASRGPVRRTRLNKAYEFNGRIAVLVEYDGNISEGFENSRYYVRKYIVVTGVVPK